MCNKRSLVFKQGLWSRSIFYINFSDEVGKAIATSLQWICLRNDFSRKYFSFRHCPNFSLYSSMVFGLKQSSFQKNISIQRMLCIVYDVILRRRNNDFVIKGRVFPGSAFDFNTAWRMLFCFQIRFLRMPELFHQMFKQIVRSDYNFFDVNLEKNLIFDSNRALSIARRAFSCYHNMVSRSRILVYTMLVSKLLLV